VLKTITPILAIFILVACNTLKAETGEIFYIDSQVVDCEGVIPQKCMRTRTEEDGNWQLFYDQIEGFEYAVGYRYKLRVKITERENAPADASSLQYKLIEVIEKTPVAE